jgi:hypothetical protein
MQKIPQGEYEQAVGEFKQQVGMTLNVFNMYGMGDYIPSVCGEIVTLAEQFAMKVRGKNVKIKTRDKPRERGEG